MNDSPKKSTAFFFAFISFIIFYAIEILSTLLLSLLVVLISSVPVLGKLVSLFFLHRGDSPSFLVIIIGSLIAYFSTSAVLDTMAKEPSLCRLSSRYLGIALIVANVVFCIINLSTGGSIMANGMIIVSGIFFIRNFKL